MDAYTMTYEVRWSDIDANRHLRSSVYLDVAADLRSRYFTQHGLPPEVFDRLTIAPVYTSLTANFFREVRLGEILTVTYLLLGLSPQAIHWKVHHDFLKTNGKKAVTISVEGAIINLSTRQPTAPPPDILAVFQDIPHSRDFEVLSENRLFRKPALND